MSDFMQSEAGPSTQKGPAQNRSRSRACLHCRRRKMKCDGVKPACFQCVRAERGSECEYDDGTTKTQTQLLYERLQFLEKRLRELQAAKGKTKGRLSARNDTGPSRRSSRNGKSPMPPHQSDVHPSYPNAYRDRYAAYSDSNTFSYNVPLEHSSRSPSVSGHSEESLTPPSTTSSALSFPTHMFPPSHLGPQQPEYVSRPPNQQLASYGYAYGAHQHQTSSHLAYRNPLEGLDHMNFHESEIMNTSMDSSFGGSTPGRSHYNGMPVLLPNGQELSPDICRNLFDICFLHGHQIGFTPLPTLIRNSDLNGVPLAARYTTCLWGAHFSNDAHYTALKPWFLRRAIEELPDLLHQAQSGHDVPVNVDGNEPLDAPLPVCQAIQVCTVLASYLYAHDRPLEGAYHASTAARLALVVGLHRTQLFPSTPALFAQAPGGGQKHPYYNYPYFPSPTSTSNEPPSPAGPQLDFLEPPRTETEALRRLYVFWNCFIVERSWNAAYNIPSSPWAFNSSFHKGDDRGVISAPWPEDWGLFGPEEQSLVTPTISFRSSLVDRLEEGTPYENFIAGTDYGSQYRLEMRAKSTALFDIAARLGELRTNHCPVFTPAVSALQSLLSGFIKRLPSLQSITFTPTSFVDYTLFTTHSMAHASVIRLNYFSAKRAYECGYIVSVSDAIIKSGHISEAGSQKAVLDSLLAYESVISQPQDGFQMRKELTEMYEPVPIEKGAEISIGAGRLIASLDMCLYAAREIVKIVQQVSGDLFSYLEPVISHCWALAANILLLELRRLSLLAKQSAPPAPPPHVQTETQKIVHDLQILIAGLQCVGAVFPIGVTHARNVQAAMSAINL